MPRLAPSILSADFGRLESDLRAVEGAGAGMIHIDVMDGHFVPNITIGPIIVKAVRRYTKLPLDVHLMISDPEKYLDAFVEAGASSITFHAEATAHGHRLAQRIRDAGLGAGIAINPGTPVGALDGIVDFVDYVLVMSVNPGFGGQSFIPDSIAKIAETRELIKNVNPAVEIEVDGGITPDNARAVIDAGADDLVGTAVFLASADSDFMTGQTIVVDGGLIVH